MPALDDAHTASIVISASEAVAYHDQFLTTKPEAYGPLVRKRLQDAYRWTALDLLRAQATLEAVTVVFAGVFETVDCLVGAVLPAEPPKIGDTTVKVNGRETGVVDAFTRLNAPQNMAGVPALSVPCGKSRGLPVGLQIISAGGRDELALRLGAAYQRATN
jgi:aspartyl-tRNA(Asn)/glutamyl-tRNA(Gln) amidotransferase subunit A